MEKRLVHFSFTLESDVWVLVTRFRTGILWNLQNVHVQNVRVHLFNGFYMLGRGLLKSLSIWKRMERILYEKHRKFLYEKVERPSIHSLLAPFNNYYFFPAEFVCICISVWFCIRLLGQIAEPILWALWVSVSV